MNSNALFIFLVLLLVIILIIRLCIFLKLEKSLFFFVTLFLLFLGMSFIFPEQNGGAWNFDTKELIHIGCLTVAGCSAVMSLLLAITLIIKLLLKK